MREFYSVSFCLFAVFAEPFGGVEALVRGIGGLQKTCVHTPERAHDPFLNDGAPPPLVLQLYFESLSHLESCDGALHSIRGLCEVQAMLVRSFPVAEPKEPKCTYLVAYEGKAEDENAWHAHYLKHHPPLMARLPGIRELEIYTRVDWISGPGWRRADCMQRNKVAFDSAAALTAALNSPVRKEMRADFGAFPAYAGRVMHYPMATRVLRSTVM
jgi:uncharacterized protein (TIGR02118 family)